MRIGGRRRRVGRDGIARGSSRELLHDVAEIVLADVVDLRLGLSGSCGGLERGRRWGFADRFAELVDA